MTDFKVLNFELWFFAFSFEFLIQEGMCMFFKRKKQDDKKEKVVISFTQKLGIVCLRSLEEYIAKNKIIKCYIIVFSPPHQNVINYARNIALLEIIISSNFKQEVEKIRKLYKNNSVKMINLADFGERNMMRDVD